MDPLADNRDDLYELWVRPAVGDTLEDAVRFEEQSLGYPLNLMSTLYYESSFCELSYPAEEQSQTNPEYRDER